MPVLENVGPLFLAAECAPIRSRVKKAARASVVNISMINGFFVMAICMCATLLVRRIVYLLRVKETKIALEEETISAGFREIQMWDLRVNFVNGEIGAIDRSVTFIGANRRNKYATEIRYSRSH
jgi:hypothetical protein